MEKTTERNQISMMTAVILIFFMLAFFVGHSVYTHQLSLPGFAIVIRLQMIDIITPFCALYASLGVYELISRKLNTPIWQKLVHLIIPFATVTSCGVTLRVSDFSTPWWLLFFFSGVLVFAVLYAECVISDPDDPHAPLAQIMLTGLCYAVYLLIAVAVRSNVIRLALELPILALAIFLVSLRLYSIWVYDRANAIHSLVTMLLCVQAAAALHYWPVNVLSYGILMFIWYYVLSRMCINISRGVAIRKSFVGQIPATALAAIALLVIELVNKGIL